MAENNYVQRGGKNASALYLYTERNGERLLTVAGNLGQWWTNNLSFLNYLLLLLLQIYLVKWDVSCTIITRIPAWNWISLSVTRMNVSQLNASQ